MKKELERSEKAKATPVFNDDVKHKVKNFVKGYMKKVGTVYVRDKKGDKDIE